MRVLWVVSAFVTACAGEPALGDDPADGGTGAPDADPALPPADASVSAADAGAAGEAPELGTGDHGPVSVDLVAITGTGDLVDPFDLAFDPANGNLWVVNQGDSSWTIYPPGGA